MKNKFTIIAICIVSIILLDVFVLALPSLTKSTCNIAACKTNSLQKNVKASLGNIMPAVSKVVWLYQKAVK